MKCYMCEQEATTEIKIDEKRLNVCDTCLDKPDTLENYETNETMSVREFVERYVTEIPLGQAITGGKNDT